MSDKPRRGPVEQAMKDYVWACVRAGRGPDYSGFKDDPADESTDAAT